MNVADQFKGLPMEDLIGAPLSAAVTANLNMAQSTADFINQVGFEQHLDPETKKMVIGKARMIDFEFQRPNTDKDGNRVVDLVKLSAPMLAIVPIPALQVENIDIIFDMEVKSATTSEDNSARSGTIEANVSGGTALFKASVKVTGSISSSQKNTRSTDTSAKYHVEVKAVNRTMPEGLARVLDMMNQAIKPVDVKQFKPENGKLPVNDKGQVDVSKGIAVDNEGKETAQAA